MLDRRTEVWTASLSWAPWAERIVWACVLLMGAPAVPPPEPPAEPPTTDAAAEGEPLEAEDVEPALASPPLALPVEGSWLVVEIDDVPRHSLSLMSVDSSSAAAPGDRLENSAHPSYGQPVRAMGAGEVTMVVDGVPDHPPGDPWDFFRFGNVVVIRHADDLYSVYGHLSPGSARFEPGERVARGEVVAVCGNSGASDEPRVYVHLQDGPIIGEARAVEPRFATALVERDGLTTRTLDAALIAGDIVTSPESGAASHHGGDR